MCTNYACRVGKVRDIEFVRSFARSSRRSRSDQSSRRLFFDGLWVFILGPKSFQEMGRGFLSIGEGYTYILPAQA